MPLSSPSSNSPWPVQTPPPSQSRKRRILSPLDNRSLSPRQQVFNQTGVGTSSPLLCGHAPATELSHPPTPLLHCPSRVFVFHYFLIQRYLIKNKISEAALQQCEFFSSNDVRSCFPTSDSVVPQHEWATFVCAYFPPPTPYRRLIPSPHLPLCLLGNSRLPDLTQTNLVNIYLFHADSRTEVLRISNVTNPFGQAGQIARQVDDLWFPDGGVNFNGSSISYPYYWVITRSDKTLDGTEIPQATFTAVRKCCCYPTPLTCE